MTSKRDIQSILNALMAFEEAARASSFTLAARSLGMAQPSVSRFIANLEQHVGVRLFVRHHNRVALTEHGEQLYEATALGLGHIRSVLDELSVKGGNRTMTISCTHGFAHMWVLPRVDSLKAKLIDHEIRITTSDHTTGFIIDHNQMIVRFGNGGWRDGESVLLFEEEVFPVCSPAFAAQHKLLDRKVRPREIAKLPLIVQDNGEYGWLNWSGWLASHGVPHTQSTAQTINNYAFVLQAAMEGKGIALAWHGLIEPYLSNGWLTEVRDLRVRTDKGYYLMSPFNHPLVDVVNNWITETA